MITLAQALQIIRPGALWAMKAGSASVADLIWLDATQQAPSQAELDAAITAGPTFASLKAVEDAKWKATREQYAGRLASIASRLYASDPASSASCDAVATSLLSLFTDPAVLAATDIAAYKLALKARYTQAVMLATVAARAEFGRYDK